jgi:hypothetical protein
MTPSRFKSTHGVVLPAGLGSDAPELAGRSKPRYGAPRAIRRLPLPRAPEGLSGPHTGPRGPSRRGLPLSGLPADFGAPGWRA